MHPAATAGENASSKKNHAEPIVAAVEAVSNDS